MLKLYELSFRKDGKVYFVNSRRIKKVERFAINDPLYIAFHIGLDDRMAGRKRPNLYPPGKRREEYLTAFL